MTAVPDFLLAWARGAGPAKVLAQARDRLESGRRLGVRAVIDVPLAGSERREVGRMLDASWTLSGGPVRVRELRDGLASHGVTLEELLVEIGGPLRDLREETRLRQETELAAKQAAVAELVGLLGVPLSAGFEGPVRDALSKWVLRGAPTGQRVAEVGRVVQELPGSGVEHLAVLAARVFGDAHALDRSKSLGRAVARFFAIRAGVVAAPEGDALGSMLESDAVADEDSAIAGVEDDIVDDGTAAEDFAASGDRTLGVRVPAFAFVDPLAKPDDWRDAWASANVACDEVSSMVLVLNLPLAGDAPAVALCSAVPGEPTWLTLRSLRGRFTLPEAMDVFVCENPSIVEETASKFGANTHPLVCTFGRPSTAAWKLLRGIVPNARLHVRADADATGRSIVSGFLEAFPDAVSWRMPVDSHKFEEELLPDLLADLGLPTPNGGQTEATGRPCD